MLFVRATFPFHLGLRFWVFLEGLFRWGLRVFSLDTICAHGLEVYYECFWFFIYVRSVTVLSIKSTLSFPFISCWGLTCHGCKLTLNLRSLQTERNPVQLICFGTCCAEAVSLTKYSCILKITVVQGRFSSILNVTWNKTSPMCLINYAFTTLRSGFSELWR